MSNEFPQQPYPYPQQGQPAPWGSPQGQPSVWGAQPDGSAGAPNPPYPGPHTAPQAPSVAPGYSAPGGQYPTAGAAYPTAGAAYPTAGPTYPTAGQAYPSAAPSYPGSAPYPASTSPQGGYPGYQQASAPGAYGAPYGAPAYGASHGQQPQAVGGGRLANWFQRVGAFLIDSVISAAPIFILSIVAAALADGSQDESSFGFLVMLGYLVMFGINVWNRWLRAGKTGQSIGKKVLGITLVDATTGQPIGAGRAVLRDFAHVLDQFLYIGYLFPLWDARKQTFADKLLSTVVTR